MDTAVSDAGPLHYLVLIDQGEIFPRLFASVFVPATVAAELDHPETPSGVRQWMGHRRPWLVIRPDSPTDDPALVPLDDGERAAIALAAAMRADLLLMDDRAGVRVSRAKGLATTGTLGLLVLAARQGLLDLGTAIARLRTTNFRCRQEIFDRVLAQAAGSV